MDRPSAKIDCISILDADRAVLFEISQPPDRCRRQPDVWVFAAAVNTLGSPGRQILQKRRQGQFSLVEDEVVHIGKLLILHGEKWSAGNNLD